MPSTPSDISHEPLRLRKPQPAKRYVRHRQLRPCNSIEPGSSPIKPSPTNCPEISLISLNCMSSQPNLHRSRMHYHHTSHRDLPKPASYQPKRLIFLSCTRPCVSSLASASAASASRRSVAPDRFQKEYQKSVGCFWSF